MRTPVSVSLVLVLLLATTGCLRWPSEPREERQEATVRIDPIVGTDALEGPVYVVEARIRTVGRGDGMKLTSPQIAVRPYERSNVSVINQLSFVQDYDTEFSKGAYIADPIIGILQDGVALDLLVAPVRGTEGSAWVAFQASAADLRKPMRRRRVHFASKGRPGCVQLPDVELGRSSGVRQARLGAFSRLALLPMPDGHGEFQIDVRLRAVGDVASVPRKTADDEAPPTPKLRQNDDSSMGRDLHGPDVDLRAMLASAEAAPAGRQTLRLQFIVLLGEPKNPLQGDHVQVPAAAAKEFLRGVRTRDVQTFELTSLAVEGAGVSSLEQHAYVQDYDLAAPLEKLRRAKQPLPAGPLAYHPVIGSIAEGRSAHVTRDETGLRLAITWADMPTMPTFRTTLDRGPSVEIGLPELRLLQSKHELRPGRHLVPLGNTIETVGRSDVVRPLAVWIDYQP